MKKMRFLLLALTFWGCLSKSSSVKTGLEGHPVPTIEFLLMDSLTIVNTNKINYDEAVVLFYFNPDCPHCRMQIKEIVTNIGQFHNTHFYLISDYPFADIKQYYKKNELYKYLNVTVGQDYNSRFRKFFKPIGVPYLAVYKSDKRLKKVLIGKASLQTIETTVLN